MKHPRMDRETYMGNAHAVDMMRVITEEALGVQCAFVEDNLRLIAGLAQRAILAGLDSDCTPDMRRRFKEAAAKHRNGHEAALGYAILTIIRNGE